jgi:fermentation-respiration switch protein FrsA (DUF1100 family)
METITFQSSGVTCAGDLYLPSDYRPGSPRPGLVVGHGFSFVKEALVAQGEYFSRAGYVTLTIDYRTFGESEGEPRGQLFPLNEVEDYRNAISYLEGREEVDAERIGIWGTSFGGAVAIYTAAVDRRVKVVVAQVPVVNGRRWMQALRTTDQWEELLDRLDADRRQRFTSGQGAEIPVTGRGSRGEFCAMPCDENIVGFIEAAKGAMKTYRSEITLESVERIIEFNPESVIHQIAPRPLCMITTAGYDVIHPVEQILDAYKKANDPKKLVLLPYHQLALYEEPEQGIALGHALEWFTQYMPATVPVVT